MNRWMKRSRLVVGAAVLLLALFAASMIPAAGVTSAEAASSNHMAFITGGDVHDVAGKPGGNGKGNGKGGDNGKGPFASGSDDDSDGFDIGGRRYSGD